ncbi:MAG: DNA-3-methyladenine glycosylase I, partial [Fusobacteriaceae bacterium]|nr:DNA-3-methyladenine glycosylase I [Fusobacteriaceae bacterium]
ARTELSDIVSKDLKKRGFKFLGSIIMYSHMQATGIINDHILGCFRYEEVQKIKK